MSAQDVVDAMEAIEDAGATAWLDGGWGVDALLGEQTREHDDLDLVIAWDSLARDLAHADGDVRKAVDALREKGFEPVKTNEFPCSFVLGATGDRRIDIHPVQFDEEGGGWQAQSIDGEVKEMGWRYPPEGFLGRGRVGGREFQCLSPEVQVLCHAGYELDEGDREDVRKLRDRFGVVLSSDFD